MKSGSCLCGKVAFTIEGEMSDMSHCHCSICRKIHGSLFATYLRATGVSYVRGQEHVQLFKSSPDFERAFCGECGSVLPEPSISEPEDTRQADRVYYVPAGLMDDDPEIRPESHIFCESKSAAYTIHDDLPQIEHYGDGDMSRVVEDREHVTQAGRVAGGCQCGDVAFDYVGTPKFMMNCHCSRCRKVKGAAHATNAFVPVAQFQWLRGQDRIRNYDHAEAERFGNAFCRRCGSSVPRESGGSGVLNIPVGSLDDAPGIEARGHIFMGSKAPWFDVSDELPQWDEMPS